MELLDKMSDKQRKEIERHKRFGLIFFASKKQLRDKNILGRKSKKDAGGAKSPYILRKVCYNTGMVL